MTAFVIAWCGVAGAIVGSFLNVVIYRLPRKQSLIRPRSACPSCRTPVAPRDNIPLLSYVVLRGRCRACGDRIGLRYPIVELVTACLFAGLAWRFHTHAALLAYLYLAAVGVALAAIDLDVRRLPDPLTLSSYPVALVLLGVAALAGAGSTAYLRAVLGMLALFGLYFLLVLIYPAGMGFGDVKLAGVLGLYTAWLGWGAWAVGAFSAFLFGGIAGVVVLLRSGGGRKTAIPFGPFMVAGALFAVFAGVPLAHAYLHTFG